MDRDRENLWTRRTNTLKSPLSVPGGDHHEKTDHPTRSFSGSKRFGGSDGSAHGRSSVFNTIPPLSTSNINSTGSGASSAFGLGSGAFASFGSATRTPKTPGTAIDFGKAASSTATPATPAENKNKALGRTSAVRVPTDTSVESVTTTVSSAPSTEDGVSWPLKYTWVIWYRPPTSKNSDYEKSTKPMCRMESAQQFWKVYTHLKRPSALPTVSDYHFFREGIRPVWEDDENKRGGKWIMRLKKGIADRYWEDLLMAMIGDQFAEASGEVCGAVLSVRSGEDVLSVWTKNDGGRNIKIRETIKRILALPPDTNIQWKSHDDSIAQRTLLDQQRHEKAAHHGPDKRRGTTATPEDMAVGKDRSSAS